MRFSLTTTSILGAMSLACFIPDSLADNTVREIYYIVCAYLKTITIIMDERLKLPLLLQNTDTNTHDNHDYHQPRILAQNKIDVCHYDKEEGVFFKISIAEPAYESHVAHGDAAPGESVPNMEGYEFDEECIPTSTASTSTSVSDTSQLIKPLYNTYHHYLTSILPLPQTHTNTQKYHTS